MMGGLNKTNEMVLLNVFRMILIYYSSGLGETCNLT